MRMRIVYFVNPKRGLILVFIQQYLYIFLDSCISIALTANFKALRLNTFSITIYNVNNRIYVDKQKANSQEMPPPMTCAEPFIATTNVTPLRSCQNDIITFTFATVHTFFLFCYIMQGNASNVAVMKYDNIKWVFCIVNMITFCYL